MKRMLHGLLVSIAVFLISVSNASAQVDRATILGTVKDTSDRRRSRRHGDRAQRRHRRSVAVDLRRARLVRHRRPHSGGVRGRGRADRIPEAQPRRVDLDTGSRTRVDFSLSIGAVEQNITVVGLSPLMNTEQSTLGRSSASRKSASFRCPSGTGTI